MALAYSAVLRVPQNYSFVSFYYLDIYEFSSSTTSGASSVLQMLGFLKTTHEGYYGGTYSWVVSSDATHDIYTISWTGLTVDPATDPAIGIGQILGNPVGIYAADESDPAQTFNTQYVYNALCEDTGNCPVCPPSVNPEDATDCPTCYPESISFCDSTIEILGLDATTEYDFQITDQSTGVVYNYNAVSNGFGEVNIVTAGFPTGLFTPYNGSFTISIFDEDGNPVTLTYGYVNYSCIELTVTNQTNIT